MSSSRGAFSFTTASSTTELAFIAALAAPGAQPSMGRSILLRDQLERLAALDEARQALLALLDGVADLACVLRRQLAHLGDDLARAQLIVHDGVDELLDGVGANRRAVAGLQRGFLDLAADVGEILEALADHFLHRFERLRALMQAPETRERGRQSRQHRLVRAEERHGLLVDAVLRVRRLHEPGHDDLARVVADRQVVREVFADLIAVLGVLHVAQLLVALELELRARDEIVAGRFLDGFDRGLQRRLRGVELSLGRLQHLQREDFGFLQRATKIEVRLQDDLLALDLVLRILDDLEIGLLDLLEAARDVAAGRLLPDVRKALERVDATVLDL